MSFATDDAGGDAGEFMAELSLAELARFLDGEMSDEEMDRIEQRIAEAEREREARRAGHGRPK